MRAKHLKPNMIFYMFIRQVKEQPLTTQIHGREGTRDRTRLKTRQMQIPTIVLPDKG